MKTKALKTFLLFVLSSLAGFATAQDFDSIRFNSRDRLIDSLLVGEAYFEAIPIIENQIKYVAQTNRTDSINRYTYNLGLAYLKAHGADACVSRMDKFIRDTEINQTRKSQFLEVLSDVSRIYYEAGKDSLCYETDLRYLTVCDNYADASALEKSQAHYALGFDFQVLFGNAKKAIYHFQKALQPVLTDSIKYQNRVMECFNALGAAYFRNGSIQQSQDILYRALNFSETLPNALNKWRHQANIYGNLSLGFQDERDLVKAKRTLYQAIDIRRNILDSLKAGSERERQQRLLIFNYHNLASLNLTLGDVSKAHSLTRYVSKLRKQWLPPDHPDNFKTLEALGSIQYAMGEYDEAQQNFNKYLDYIISKNGTYSYGTVIGFQRLANVAYQKQDYLGSIQNYTRAIEIAHEISDEFDGQDLAKTYLWRSQPYARIGEYKLAEEDIHTAQSIFSRTLPKESQVFLETLNLYSRIKFDQNEIDSAAYYVDVLIEKLLLRQNESYGEFESELSRYSNFLPGTYALKSDIILKQSASLADRKQAFDDLRTATGYLRKTQYLYTGESSLLTHFDNHNYIFQKAKDLCYELLEETEDPSYLEELYELEESFKSVWLRQHLNSFTSLRTSDVPDSILTAEQNFKIKLSDLNRDEDAGKNFIETEKQYEELQNFIRRNYPDYYDLRYSSKVATTGDLRNQLLKPDKNLIQYIITDSNAYAIVVNRSETKIVKLPSRDFDSDIDALNQSIIQTGNTSFRSRSERLYTLLFQPIEPYLTSDEIYIVPTGKLFHLNFEVLTKPGTDLNPDYLINHYTISYLLSGTTSVQHRNLNNSAPKGFLSFAPGFFDSVKKKYKDSVSQPELVDQEYMLNIQQPFAVTAALNIADMFSGTAFTSDDATEKNFKEEAEYYKIIHVGTHTQINGISPLLSRLVMTKESAIGDGNDDNDGYLHAYEIYNMNLRAELAVLTACETGIGKFSASEGMRSLAHSFAYAGCPSIVMSLWQIDGKTSSEIIEDFYMNLAQGMAKNKALRIAKLKYLGKHTANELGSPYYWSGLVLVGDVSPISATGKSSYRWFILMGLAALIIISLFIPFRNKLSA